MKKIFISLLALMILMTGCSVAKVENSSVSDILDTILYKDNNLSNTFMNGYSFYLPKGLQIVDKKDYNLEIKDHDNYYYLYVDTVLYFYKKDNQFVEDSSHFYSKKFTHDGKIGYIDVIEKENDYYYVALMYNYSKIEAYISKDNFSNAIMNMSYILSTVKYNDTVISQNITHESILSKEEKFNLFETEVENNNFLKYEEEYGTYKEQIVVGKDTDIIDVEEIVE